MRFRRDPLANPKQLISMVHRYVSYRVGDGAEADDITSDVFERAIRYRDSYDPSRGEPGAWLIGIARRSIAAAPRPLVVDAARYDAQAPGRLAEEVAQRVTLREALPGLSGRDQELLALRYGADLPARQIGQLLDLTVNAVEVRLPSPQARLRE